jgi:hypothetical protein
MVLLGLKLLFKNTLVVMYNNLNQTLNPHLCRVEISTRTNTAKYQVLCVQRLVIHKGFPRNHRKLSLLGVDRVVLDFLFLR